MIQRIQTIYLLIITILGILMCLFSVLYIADNQSIYTLSLSGVQLNNQEVIYNFIPYSVLIIFIPLISFCSIFLYKKRVLQMRINVISMILSIMLYPILFFYIYLVKHIINTDVVINYQLPIIIPIVNVILTYLAIRAIAKDEALVRSLSRIR